ncbi:hypothetical protein Ancab_034664 [Ancistrocladus abbreviatus]
MEFFRGAKAVRLKGQHNRYLIAEDDEETVRQSGNGSSRNARWIVEFVEGKKNVIRLRSCHWKYLCASDNAFLLGWTGKKVLQVSPRMKTDPSVEWEPLKDGAYMKLRSWKRMFLRANGLMPPWKDSVTHDLPHRTATQDWILWRVDVLEIDHSSEEVWKEIPDQGHNLSQKEVKADKKVEEEEEEDDEEVESSVSSSSPNWGRDYVSASPVSVRSVPSYKQAADPFARVSSTASQQASPTASASATPRVLPLVQRAISDTSQSSRHSNSFSNLKSVLDDVQKLLDGEVPDHEEMDTAAVPSAAEPTPLEVRIAKQTLKELKDLDFSSMLSSGRLKRLEKALTLLYNTSFNNPQAHSNLLNLQNQIQDLKNKHDAATNNLSQYTMFSAEKLAAKTELQQNATQARELQTKEDECNNTLMAAYAKKEELLRQLEEVEMSIRDAERAQNEIVGEIEELISIIDQKRENLKEMERKEKSWQLTKSVAERNLERVEEDWVKIKASFSYL